MAYSKDLFGHDDCRVDAVRAFLGDAEGIVGDIDGVPVMGSITAGRRRF